MSTNDELAEKFIRKCEAEVGAQIDGGLSEILSGLLDEAYERGRREENEACAKVAEQYGPNRPIVGSFKTEALIRGRWEGEQAASYGISLDIRARIKKGESDE